MNDYLDPINSVGMPEQADSGIALDLLLTAKEAVRTYAIALTEATSPELRMTLRNQMELAIDYHEEVSKLMMKKKWFHPYNISEQKKLDLQAAQTAVDIAGLNLFPGNTNRKGLFPTPPQ
ncbi:spore coat protein GerQ [Alkalihalobacillus alcalophilus ATCC 27647 = CGMCC 1.3604]|uniref:Spore coat protein GerQ n=1 Tax=Alkalihalobacillus alcalophilus ATCC 27647 = CGMCC 1.3604 TaxID=1218173 RepID=A0A094WCJ5_ALKAL|nr:spore coat protein [Alkalihalobacillus alcalophilus]KGA95504.1 spore gernimation protein GerQ [Alkalihalobacillus alcalophilus ATCC 27647 = CGMCC 1.3604]MED1564032.1 spore coat protein [Alkalihalobacillus alcalophilus]THG89617.1 spore coat protein GerQ [Alkalihalobacillus alcalophilus ATCC 27647 = CGMCC 1.3604]